MDATRIGLLFFACLFKFFFCYTFVEDPKSHMKLQQWDATSKGFLSFRFKTYQSNGLLLYTDNSRNQSSRPSAVLIELRRAKLHVVIQMGADDYRSRKEIEVGENLNNMQWHTVQLVRHGRETQVILDDEPYWMVSDGEGYQLALDSGLFVGGVPAYFIEGKNRSGVIFQNVKETPRYIGCIESIRFTHSHNVDDTTKTYSRAIIRVPEEVEGVKDGCFDACANITEDQRCRNHGKCRNKFTKFDCDCRGTGFEGNLCTKVSDSIQFDGRLYITLAIPRKMDSKVTTDLAFRFRTKQKNGVIFAARSHRDHIMVELFNTIVRFSIDLGGGHAVSLFPNIPFNDGAWHLVEIKRKARLTRIIVDKRYSINTTTLGVHPHLNLRNLSLYVGGHPNVNALEMMRSKSKANFTGCLQQAYFNGVDIVYDVLQDQSSLINKYGQITRGCSIGSRSNKYPIH